MITKDQAHQCLRKRKFPRNYGYQPCFTDMSTMCLNFIAYGHGSHESCPPEYHPAQQQVVPTSLDGGGQSAPSVNLPISAGAQPSMPQSAVTAGELLNGFVLNNSPTLSNLRDGGTQPAAAPQGMVSSLNEPGAANANQSPPKKESSFLPIAIGLAALKLLF